MKYQFIEANQRCYPVRAMCKALQVSARGYYASRSRALSTRSQRQNLLTDHIRAIHSDSRETYGAPRIHAELSAQGIACCEG